jgi:hypothetical protein
VTALGFAKRELQMEPERWQEVKELFGAALERPSADRALFVPRLAALTRRCEPR